MTGIAKAVQTSTELRKPLTALVNKGCVPVGGIFRLDYDSAVVLTDDFKKHEAGGVPRGGFLLAVAGENTPSGFMLEDQEVILLRVRGTAPLPNESELIQTRLIGYGSEYQRSIGQLIFDPQGEYANVNRQDGTGLRLLGDD